MKLVVLDAKNPFHRSTSGVFLMEKYAQSCIALESVAVKGRTRRVIKNRGKSVFPLKALKKSSLFWGH